MSDIDPRALNSQNSWTDAAVELLKRELALGTSGSQISKKLRSELGIIKSRNAVIGKAGRLKIEKPIHSRASTPRRPNGFGFNANAVRARKLQADLQKTAEAVKAVTPAFVKMAAALVPMAAALRAVAHSVGARPAVFQPPVTLLDLEAGQCRMVVSDDNAPEPLFCGCRCERGRRGQFQSYCGPHRVVTLAGASRLDTRGARIPAISARLPSVDQIGRRYNA